MAARRSVGHQWPIFKHKPLDQSDATSIRLIRVLPDLSPAENLIQCEIIHANTETYYACLSYVWGAPSPLHDILIRDGDQPDATFAKFAIQPNLWEFLNAARIKFPYSHDPEGNRWWDERLYPLWIDAICIVQKPEPKLKNSKKANKKKRRGRKERFNHPFEDDERLKERNQQVQMMGKIYDRRQVIAWLGIDEDIGDFIRDFAKDPRMYLLDSANGKKFMHAGYWTRAWVTQEIELAENITILSGMRTLGIREFDKALGQFMDDQFQGSMDRYDNYFWTHLVHPYDPYDRNQHNGLIRALQEYRNKQSTNLADRIYSLRALCNDGQAITVDYARSKTQLMVETLQACSSTLCLCSVATVASTLGITHRRDYKGDVWMQRHGLQFRVHSASPYEEDGLYGCSGCKWLVPQKFYRCKGIVFCLNSVCVSGGHFFWKNPLYDFEIPDHGYIGRFHYQPDVFLNHYFKCDEPLIKYSIDR